MTEKEIIQSLNINAKCDTCAQNAEFACCILSRYCSVSCQGVAWEKHQHVHKKPIEYIATGGIAGTTVHFILHPNGKLEDVKKQKTIQIEKNRLHDIYLLADKSNFYPQDQLKLPKGFDIPRYLYYYGDLVAKKSEVLPELNFAFSNLTAQRKETAFHPIQVNVGEVFEYKYGMSAIDLSDGLVIVKEMRGTNMSVLKIKAIEPGIFKITETNGLTTVRETRVVAKMETQKFIDSLIKKGHTCIETFETYPPKIKYWCKQEICENNKK
jgi:hypothetical protein